MLVPLWRFYTAAAAALQAPSITLPNNATITGTLATNAAGHHVRVFRGIPYAEPPVGDLRWRQTTLKPVTKDVNATQFGNVCFNYARAGTHVPTESEDCLFLNVFSPAEATRDSKLPVMVWIHGGAFVRGFSNEHDGSNLVGAADQKAVFVSINYRLGVFGFLSNEAVLAQGDGANFSLRDQEIAFQWVKQYIREFGGNPDDSTAFGQSSGSMSVALHLISRDGDQKIFQRGIMESGGYTPAFDTTSKSVQANFTARLAEGVGCSTSDKDLLTCLRAADARAVFNAVGTFDWRPVVDGIFLKDVPIRRVLAGKLSRVPTIVGVNTNEGWFYTLGNTEPDQFESYVRSGFPSLIDSEYARVNELYAAEDFKSPHHRSAQVMTDAIFVCPSQLLSAQLAALDVSPTFRYRFNEPSPAFKDKVAVHAEELPYVFGRTGELPSDLGTKTLVKEIQKFWTNFIRTGNPNDNSTSVWPRYDVGTKKQILLQQVIGVEHTGDEDPRHNERCAFWYEVDQRIATHVSE